MHMISFAPVLSATFEAGLLLYHRLFLLSGAPERPTDLYFARSMIWATRHLLSLEGDGSP